MFLYSHETLHRRKGGIWVLRDEISHYVRNDMVGALVLVFNIVVLHTVSEGDFAPCQPVASATGHPHRAPPQGTPTGHPHRAPPQGTPTGHPHRAPPQGTPTGRPRQDLLPNHRLRPLHHNPHLVANADFHALGGAGVADCHFQQALRTDKGQRLPAPHVRV